MKYWDKLRSIEDEIIRLDSVESLLRVLGNADAKREDVLNIVWYLEGSIENINKNLSEKFYELWEEVRNNSYKKDATDYVPPTQASNELTEIVNSWVR